MHLKRMLIVGVTFALLSTVFLGSGCKSTQREGVVCTTGMIADIVTNVGGPHVQVNTLMPPGSDPHQYQLTTLDRNTLARAELIFYNGLGLEHKMTNILEQMNAPDRPAVAVTRALDQSKLLPNDPHVWHDVAMWSECADVVYEELAKKYPQHKDAFKANLEKYKQRLAALDAEVTAKIKSIPVPEGLKRPVLVTAHDAFSYFADRYGLDVRSLQGKNTVAEMTTVGAKELGDFLGKNNIKTVFVESTLNKDRMKKLQDYCPENHVLTIGEELYSDALGKQGSPAESYAGMIRHNVDAIVEGLK